MFESKNYIGFLISWHAKQNEHKKRKRNQRKFIAIGFYSIDIRMCNVYGVQYVVHRCSVIIIGALLFPLQYACLENPMDRGAWRATVDGLAKSLTWLSDYQSHTFIITKTDTVSHFHFHYYWFCFFNFFPFLFFLVDVFFFYFFLISWRLITLQYCSGFCHTLTWISHGFACFPHPDPPSRLPLHPIPQGLPSAPALSTCLMHPTWAGDLFHHR